VQELAFGLLSKQHPLMATLMLGLLLNHDVSGDITGNDGRIPVRAAGGNVHLEVN